MRFASPIAGLEVIIGRSHQETHSGMQKLFSADMIGNNVIEQRSTCLKVKVISLAFAAFKCVCAYVCV